MEHLVVMQEKLLTIGVGSVADGTSGTGNGNGQGGGVALDGGSYSPRLY
jgi:hypothetical protein